MADVHELMLEFWDLVPREPGCGRVEINVSEETGEVLFDERTVIEEILLGVKEIAGRNSRFIIIPEDTGVIDVLFPRNELIVGGRKVEMGVVESVICDPPECARVVAGVP